MTKIKEWFAYASGLIILILSALLFRKSKKLDQAESELVQEKSNEVIRENEKERISARDDAERLADEYEKLRGDDR